MTSDINKGRLEWVIREIEFYGRYHNHKETMAWTATAFYIPGIIVLGHAIPDITMCWLLVPIFLLFLGAASLVGAFLHMQFSNRWEAHYIVVGLMRVAARLCTVQALEDAEVIAKGNDRWPQFIEKEINNAKKFEESRIRSDRCKTEFTSYGAIALATLIALVLLCF